MFKPLPFYIPFLIEKVTLGLSYTFHRKMLPPSRTYSRNTTSLFGWTVRDILEGPLYLNDSLLCPLLCFGSSNPYPFICIHPVKGTPFGRSLPV